MLIQSSITWTSFVEKTVLTQNWDHGFVKRVNVIKLWDANIFCVTHDDRVYSCGTNNYDGSLGLGHVDEVREPTEITQLAGIGVVEIVCGRNQVFARTKTGQLWAWGNMASVEEDKLVLVPELVFQKGCASVVVGKAFIVLLTADGTVFVSRKPDQDDACLNLIELTISDRICMIACGFQHSLMLTTAGQVYGFGCNKRNVLGNQSVYVCQPQNVNMPDDEKVEWIACAPQLSAFITVSHKLWLLGEETRGFKRIAFDSTEFQPRQLFIVSNKHFIGAGNDNLFLCTFTASHEQLIAVGWHTDQANDSSVWHVCNGLTLAELVMTRAKRQAMPLMVKIIPEHQESEKPPLLVQSSSSTFDEIADLQEPETLALNQSKDLRFEFEPQQSLEFNSPPLVFERIKQSFNDCQVSDVTFVVDGVHLFHGHKIFLSMVSQHFRRKFATDWKDLSVIDLGKEPSEYSGPIYYSYARFLYTHPLHADTLSFGERSQLMQLMDGDDVE